MPVLRAVDGIDPKLTENYLLGHSEVLEASVFWNQGQLTAHVTLIDESKWTPRKLKAMVCEDLGLHQTPREVTFHLARLRVA